MNNKIMSLLEYSSSPASYKMGAEPSEELNIGDELNGDLCEWNDITQRETVISDCYHKFVFNPDVFDIGASLTNPIGYYYKPFFSIRIKGFSDYIEEIYCNDRRVIKKIK